MVGPAVLGYSAPPPMFPGLLNFCGQNYLFSISGLDPVPPPNLDAGATPLLEGSVVGGEVRAKYFQELSKYLNVADYEGILFEVELVAQGAGEGPAGSTTGDPVVATSSVQGGNVPPPAMVRFLLISAFHHYNINIKFLLFFHDASSQLVSLSSQIPPKVNHDVAVATLVTTAE